MKKLIGKMIKKVLVANRGEIACRIIKTLSRLGIESSVVFSREDEGSLAVEMADKSFLLKDPENKSQEYLDINQIIKIAKQNGIDAVHPGYGFLSENDNHFNDIANLLGDIVIQILPVGGYGQTLSMSGFLESKKGP